MLGGQRDDKDTVYLKHVYLLQLNMNRSGRGVLHCVLAQTSVYPYIVAWPNVKVTV